MALEQADKIVVEKSGGDLRHSTISSILGFVTGIDWVLAKAEKLTAARTIDSDGNSFSILGQGTKQLRSNHATANSYARAYAASGTQAYIQAINNDTGIESRVIVSTSGVVSIRSSMMDIRLADAAGGLGVAETTSEDAYALHCNTATGRIFYRKQEDAGRKYPTVAALPDPTTFTPGAMVRVFNDVTTSNNKTYVAVGSGASATSWA